MDGINRVCIWEEFSQKGPPAPQVCLPIASLLVDGISSNLALIFSSPGKISEFGAMTF